MSFNSDTDRIDSYGNYWRRLGPSELAALDDEQRALSIQFDPIDINGTPVVNFSTRFDSFVINPFDIGRIGYGLKDGLTIVVVDFSTGEEIGEIKLFVDDLQCTVKNLRFSTISCFDGDLYLTFSDLYAGCPYSGICKVLLSSDRKEGRIVIERIVEGYIIKGVTKSRDIYYAVALGNNFSGPHYLLYIDAFQVKVLDKTQTVLNDIEIFERFSEVNLLVLFDNKYFNLIVDGKFSRNAQGDELLSTSEKSNINVKELFILEGWVSGIKLETQGDRVGGDLQIIENCLGEIIEAPRYIGALVSSSPIRREFKGEISLLLKDAKLRLLKKGYYEERIVFSCDEMFGLPTLTKQEFKKNKSKIKTYLGLNTNAVGIYNDKHVSLECRAYLGENSTFMVIVLRWFPPVCCNIRLPDTICLVSLDPPIRSKKCDSPIKSKRCNSPIRSKKCNSPIRSKRCNSPIRSKKCNSHKYISFVICSCNMTKTIYSGVPPKHCDDSSDDCSEDCGDHTSDYDSDDSCDKFSSEDDCCPKQH